MSPVARDHTAAPGVARSLRAQMQVPAAPLRGAGAAMLAVGAAWNTLPLHPPPCPLRALAGIPCPLCGASRGAVAALRGDLGAGLTWNPLGVLAVLVALGLLVGWVLRWRPAVLRAPVWLPVATLGAVWTYNLALNPHF